MEFRGVLDLLVVVVLSVVIGGVLGSQGTPTARIVLISTDPSAQLIRTITDKVNHEVVLTLPTSVNQAYLFQCNATFPVEWNYFGEGAPSTSADVGRQFKDFYNVNSYTYQATLFLHQLDELQSGRYVCRGAQPDQERLQVHYDLFVPGNGSHMLISNAEKKVFVPDSKLITSLPCEVTDPSISINLYKGDEWSGYHRVEMNDSIAFRPRKGFILKLDELPDPFGTYMCITPDNRGRRKVHLIPEKLKAKYDDNNVPAVKVPVHLSYDYEYNRMLCCSGSATAPRLQWAACGSVLDCKIKSVCFEEDRCEGGKARWTDPGPVPKGCAAWKLNDDLQGDYGIFKCSNPGQSNYLPYLLNRGQLFTDFDTAPPSESILTLSKTSGEGPVYVGSEVEYFCNSTRFYFAYGIRWAFKRGNEDIEFIEESSAYVVRDKYPQTSHLRRTTFRILHADIKAIICFVPIANSPTEWRTVSLPLSIRDSSSHTLSPQLYPYPPPTQDYLNNRIPYPPIVEPYSTNRPKVLHPHHRNPIEQVDPTPSVDIGDIISLPNKKPSQTHPPMIPIDSLSSNSHLLERDYLYSTDPPSRPNYYFTTTPPPPPPQPSYSHPSYRGPEEKQPDIITLDNVHHFQHHNPIISDMQEANMRHRQRFQMTSSTTTQKPTTTITTPPTTPPPPPPPPPPTSLYDDRPKYPQDYQRQQQQQHQTPSGHYQEQHYSHHQQTPGHSPERDWHEFSTLKDLKEYKVSSQVEFGPKYKPGIVEHSDKYLPTYTTTPPPPPPPPPRYIPPMEEASLETFVAPKPHPHHSERPSVIHYDSREKQYSLKAPLVTNDHKWKTMKAPPPYEHDKNVYYQTTPPPSSPPHYYEEKKSGPPLLEAVAPSKLDMSYSPSEYFSSSQIAKQRQREPTPTSSSKSSRPYYHHHHHNHYHPSEASPEEEGRELQRSESVVLHHHHPSSLSSPGGNYDREERDRDRYYSSSSSSRYALEPKEGWERVPTRVHSHSYDHQRHSKRPGYHAVSGEFVEMS